MIQPEKDALVQYAVPSRGVAIRQAASKILLGEWLLVPEDRRPVNWMSKLNRFPALRRQQLCARGVWHLEEV
jgi:hypothetical protein